MDLFARFFDGSLMPHGYCLLWRNDLLLLHVGGDALTTTSYFLIPLALVSLVRNRPDLAFDRLFLMFATFIFLCGITHLLSIVNVWHGYYFIEGLAKAATGLISALTAFAVWRLLPQAIALPSRDALIQKNEELRLARIEVLEANAQLELKVKERTAALEEMAIVDPLTGVFRRNHVMELLDKDLARAQRYDSELSVAMIDLDDFKRINDDFGHLAGDQVLQEVGAALKEAVRAPDTLGRYGGEEFIVVMPECSREQALLAAERLADTLRRLRIALPSGQTLQITCSVGTAQAEADLESRELLDRADKALYEAKREGKDRVIQS